MLLILFVMMFGIPLLSLLKNVWDILTIVMMPLDQHRYDSWNLSLKLDFLFYFLFFISFYKMISTQFHTNIKVIRTNNAQEYFLKDLFIYLFILLLVVLFISIPILQLYNKNQLRREKTNIFWAWLEHLSFSLMYLSIYGVIVFLLLYMSSIGCLHLFCKTSHLLRNYIVLPSYDQK